MDLEAFKTLLTEQIKAEGDDDLKDTMKLLLEKIASHNALDQDFIELLRILADGDGATLHKVNKYAAIAEELDQNSTVIYFKSAGLFRVYQSKDLERYFVNRTGAEFNKQKEIYEVIDDSKPQKIVIIIDSQDKTELVKIKQYILGFSEDNGVNVSEEDLIVFDNTSENTYEIIIKSWIVRNSVEKNEKIQQLLKYIAQKEKSAVLSNKMNVVKYSDIPNTTLLAAPGIKKLISKYTTDLDGFATQGNVIIIAENFNMVSGDMITNNYTSEAEPELDFTNYLESANLDWYEPGNIIDYDVLLNEYIKLYGSIKPITFTKKYVGILFKKHSRPRVGNKRVQKIKIL